MALIPHRTQTGLNAAHPPFYASESDPTTTLGAYRGWIKPSTGEVWIRNAANTAWIDITSTALAVHLADTSDAHDASAISILDTAAQYTATNAEGALAEVLDALQAHEADTADAHDASAISVLDSGAYFTATHVEGALQELGAGGGGGGGNDSGIYPDAVTYTSNITLDPDEHFYVQGDASDHTLTLPLSNDNPGKQFVIKSFTGTITIDLQSGDAIDDEVDGTYLLSADEQGVMVEAHPTFGWYVISEVNKAGYRNLVTLASDVSTTSATFANITGLSFPANSGVTYRFHFLIHYDTASTTNGAAFSINGPASTLLGYYSTFGSPTPTTIQHNTYNEASADASTANLTSNIAIIEGVVKPSAGGTLIARFLSENSGTQITAKAGSALEWW